MSHNPKIAKTTSQKKIMVHLQGRIYKSVGKEFNQADKGGGLLKRALSKSRKGKRPSRR